MPNSSPLINRDAIVELAKWQGAVGEMLSALKISVAELRKCSATKEDVTSSCKTIESVQQHLEQTLNAMETNIKDSIAALRVKDIEQRVTATEKELATLNVAFKIKSSAWGLLGGLIPAAAALIYIFIQTS